MKAPSLPPRPLIEAGTHIARLIWLIDLGTSVQDFGNEKKIRHRLRATFETPDALAVFKEGELAQPFAVSKTFTFSMHEKAALRQFIESWRGKALTAEEAADYEFSKLIGQPCLLTVTHKTTPEGKVVADITGVSRLMKGQVCPPQINPSLKYEITDGQNEVFKSLPEWLRNEILASVEFNKDSKPDAPSDDGYAEGEM